MTSDIKSKPAVNICIYGEAKVGKSTFCSSAKDVLVCDAEAGYRYMFSRDIDIPIASIENWDDMGQFYLEAKKPKYKTIVIDPVDELLDKLMNKARLNPIYIQKGDKNAFTMKGWGFIKGKMKEMLKTFRDLEKNVIFVAHIKNESDEGSIRKIPKISANLVGDLMAMMDAIGYMSIVNRGEESKRVICFKPSPGFEAGDRTGTLPEYFNPDDGFEGLYKILLTNKQFIKSKEFDAKAKKNKDDFLADMGEDAKVNPFKREESPEKPVKPEADPSPSSGVDISEINTDEIK